MASARKSKKAKATVAPATRSAKQREMDAATTPEEMLERLPAAKEEHRREVRELGDQIIDLIEQQNFHPIVALDAFHLLISAGIGHTYGASHKTLWDAYVKRFHEESRLLTLIESLEKTPTKESEEA